MTLVPPSRKKKIHTKRIINDCTKLHILQKLNFISLEIHQNSKTNHINHQSSHDPLGTSNPYKAFKIIQKSKPSLSNQIINHKLIRIKITIYDENNYTQNKTNTSHT